MGLARTEGKYGLLLENLNISNNGLTILSYKKVKKYTLYLFSRICNAAFNYYIGLLSLVHSMIQLEPHQEVATVAVG